MESFKENAIEWIVFYGPKLIGAILILIIGFQIIKGFSKWMKRILQKRNIDLSLQPFLLTMTGTLLKTLLVISAMGMIGIEMTSFIAILGAAGLAIGLALSGTLQNFASGVIILIFKPYKVGDYIQTSNHAGTVSEIQIFVTILKTPDNVTILIPNSELANNSIKNYSAQIQRRVDWTFGVAYGDDYEKAKTVLMQIISDDKRILHTPEPFVALTQLADSSVNIVVRTWVNAVDYWSVYFDMNEKVAKTFPKEGLNFPFPQMDIHLDKISD
jgi:small conductance mechanosensitive channel